MKQIYFLILLSIMISCSVNAQNVTLENGITITTGDTLELVDGKLGRQYAHITYKYVGVPAIGIKKRGPVSDEHNGQVLFVEKVDVTKGIIILEGIKFYKLECHTQKAFDAGEIKRFKNE